MTRFLAVSCRVVLCLSVSSALAAQQPPGRKIEGELSGNLFFGNTRQVLASTRAEFERADSGSAFRTIGRFNYGETTTDAAGTEVSKRSWNAGSNYDYRPFADFTPYVRASMESSLEAKIARRYSVGAGSRYHIVGTTATDAIFAVARGARVNTDGEILVGLLTTF